MRRRRGRSRLWRGGWGWVRGACSDDSAYTIDRRRLILLCDLCIGTAGVLMGRAWVLDLDNIAALCSALVFAWRYGV